MKSPIWVYFLKHARSRCFKDGDSELYVLAIAKLLCFSCIVSKVDEETIRSLPITLNLNLAAAERKQGKFDNAKNLCSLVLEFDPYNIKALFRRAKAALGLYNIQEALFDLRDAWWIHQTNIEIIKELRKLRVQRPWILIGNGVCIVRKLIATWQRRNVILWLMKLRI